ncbi:VOC family protein [Ralstonia solanacearum]|uniref:VOC family protein n=1 Tax=Ralstonia solanacearum TaxID=305 RepID=UPI003513D773
MAVKPIPEGYHSVTPYLSIKGADKALDFYKQAFGATEIMRMAGPNGTIAHAEIRIGDSPVMMADEVPNMSCASPDTLQSTSVGLMIYVKDVDAVFANAIKTGATEVRPVLNQFYGDRSGTLKDPFGHVWTISTHVEDVAPEEMQRRMEKWMREQAGATA